MAELDLKAAAELLACPAWPDCADEDDEGACYACTQAAAIIAALEERDWLRAAAQDLADNPDEPECWHALRAALEGRDG